MRNLGTVMGFCQLLAFDAGRNKRAEERGLRVGAVRMIALGGAEVRIMNQERRTLALTVSGAAFISICVEIIFR